MKTTKRAVFFLFLCLMGMLMLTITSSQSLMPYDSVVYANEDDEEEEEEIDEPAPDTGSNGNYENVHVPSILATAYADGLRGAQLARDDGETAEQFQNNMETMMTQFDTIGLFIGPISASSGSGTDNVRTTLGMSSDELQNVYNHGNAGEAYWTFGRAVQNLRLDAENADTSTIGSSEVIDTLAGITTQVANIGITILRDWSPAPVVLAFSDNTLLDASEYSDNQFVKLVNNIEVARGVVSFFGSPVPAIPRISYTQLIMIVMIMLGLSVSILTVFLGERFFRVSVKKTFVKVLVMIVAVPLTMRAYDWGLETLENVAGEETQTEEYQQAGSHLLLGLWAESGFAVPDGVTLQVRDDRFILSRSDIRAINSMLVDDNDSAAITNEISRRVSTDNNETTISWQTRMIPQAGSPRPWQTDALIEVANAIGNNEDINDSSVVMENWRTRSAYFYGGNLRARRGNGSFVYSQTGDLSFSGGNLIPYGLSPIATYNLLHTSFNSNGISVRNNLSGSVTVPSVAPTAYAYSIGGATSGGEFEPDRRMPMLVRWVVQFVLMVASIKALAKIITTGFGGMLHGGARSMFGSSAGWGELFGAIFAAIFGVIGLSLISLFAVQAANVLYGMIRGMMHSMIDGSNMSTINDALAHALSPTRWLSLIPFVSDPIAGLVHDGLDFIIANVMAIFMGLFLLPKFIKIPIEAFSGWISSLPNAWAQKAQLIEARFTGDQRPPGSSTGAFAGALDKAGNGMLNSGTAVAAGGGMIAGAAAKAAGGAIAGKVGDKLGKNKDGSTSGDSDGTDSIAGATAGGLFGGGDSATQMDENGNPISENISDNENNQEGDVSGDDINAEDSANINDNEVDGDITGDEINADDQVSSDETATDGGVNAENASNSNETVAEGDTTGDAINADEQVNSDETMAGGDVNAEDSSNSNENVAEGDITGDDINANDQANSDETMAGGDVNAEDSSTVSENNAAGDVTGDTVSAEDSVNTQDSTAEGDVAGGNVNANSSSNLNQSTSDGDAIGGNVTSNDATSGGDINADGDATTANNTSSNGDVTTNDSTAGGTVAASTSSVAGDTSASNSSVAGDTSASNSSVANGGNASNASSNTATHATGDTSGGDVNANESTVAGDMNATDSTVAGDTNATASNVAGDMSANSSNVAGDMNATDSTVAGDTNATDSTVAGDTHAAGNTSNSDVNTSQSNMSSDTGGVNATTNNESAMGSPSSEGNAMAGGVSISNDATTEGNQVTTDQSSNDAKVNTDANATINQSSQDRTLNQDGNADNRQNADVKSNAQTINANQNTNANTTSNQSNTSQNGTTGSQKGVTATRGQKMAATIASGQKGTASATGNQKGVTSATGNQKGTPSATGNQKGVTSATGNQKGVTSPTGNQKGVTSVTGNQKGAPSATGNQKGAPSATGNQKGAPSTGNQKGAPSATGSQKGISTPTGNQKGVTSPTGGQNSAASTAGGRNVGQQRGSTPSATIDRNGNVSTSGSRQTPTGGQEGAQQSRQETQTGRQNTPTNQRQKENTSQKAGRISNILGRGTAQPKGNVSNAQQAAMGAVHVMGGLTGAQNITQKGVDNMKRRQGKDVDGKQNGQTGQNGSNQTAENNDHYYNQQQIIDTGDRDDESRANGKKPSFISQARNKGNNAAK